VPGNGCGSEEGDLDEAAVASLALPDTERVLLKTNSELWELPEFTDDFIRLTGSGARYLIEPAIEIRKQTSWKSTTRTIAPIGMGSALPARITFGQ
jgi:hypothetical protein